MKVYTKKGEVTGRKLYSCDKLVWFSTKEAAKKVGRIIADRTKDKYIYPQVSEESALQVAEDRQARKELLKK